MTYSYGPLLAHDGQKDLEKQEPIKPPPKLRKIQVDTLFDGPAIVKNIKPSTLENLKIVSPDNQCLVKEFWYKENDEEGCVWYEDPPDVSDTKYAVLVGINSFTQDLSTCLISVSLQISKTMAQASFCQNLLTMQQYQETNTALKLAYVAIFAVGILLWIGTSLRAARSKLKSDELAGDNVCEADRITKITYMLSMLLFQMFNVPDKLTEAPVRFHPRKAVQPYTAFKVHGHRFWILGFPSKEQYNYENGAGLLSQLPMTILVAFPLVTIQVLIGGIDFMSCITLALSALSLFWQLWLLWKILRDRRSFYKNLKESVHGGLARFEGVGEEEKNMLLVKYKLLLEYFHEEPCQEVKDMFEKFFVRK